jgi:hypothetical protein
MSIPINDVVASLICPNALFAVTSKFISLALPSCRVYQKMYTTYKVSGKLWVTTYRVFIKLTGNPQRFHDSNSPSGLGQYVLNNNIRRLSGEKELDGVGLICEPCFWKRKSILAFPFPFQDVLYHTRWDLRHIRLHLFTSNDVHRPVLISDGIDSWVVVEGTSRLFRTNRNLGTS